MTRRRPAPCRRPAKPRPPRKDDHIRRIKAAKAARDARLVAAEGNDPGRRAIAAGSHPTRPAIQFANSAPFWWGAQESKMGNLTKAVDPDAVLADEITKQTAAKQTVAGLEFDVAAKEADERIARDAGDAPRQAPVGARRQARSGCAPQLCVGNRRSRAREGHHAERARRGQAPGSRRGRRCQKGAQECEAPRRRAEALARGGCLRGSRVSRRRVCDDGQGNARGD